MASADQLARRVQALPRELYDHILDYTLTTPSTITIERAYRPPPQLQIDRATRRIASRALYGPDTTFVISNTRLCDQWVRSLSAAAQQSIQNIRYMRAVGDSSGQIAFGFGVNGFVQLYQILGGWYTMLSQHASFSSPLQQNSPRTITVRATRQGHGWDVDGGLESCEREGGERRGV